VESTEEPAGSLFPALDHVPDVVIVASADNVIRYANPAAADLLGWQPDDLIDLPLTTIVPPRLRGAHQNGVGRYVSSGHMRRAGHPMRVTALHRDGSEVDVDLRLAPIPVPVTLADVVPGPWAMGLLRDVGDLLALERELAVGRYLRASIEVAAALQKATGIDEAFEALLPELCAHLDWEMAAIWLPNSAQETLTCVAAWHDGTLPDATAAMTKGISLRFGEGLPGQVWSRQHPVLAGAATEVRDLPRAGIAAAHELNAGLGFALLGTTGPLGVVEFWSRQAHEVDEDMQAVLLSIGRQLGLFLERMDADTELRRALDVLQTSLLVAKLPSVPNLQVAAHYQPAGGRVAVGGDFYDVFPLTGGWWAFVIADVCGKGAGAAAVTAMARYTIRTAALDHDDPRDVLAILNQAMLEDDSDRPFLTGCLVFTNVHADGGVAIVTTAGHPLPLRRAADGTVSSVGVPGDLLGVMAEPSFVPRPVDLRPGDTLLLFTDGFTEARDAHDVQFGERGLAEVLRQSDAGDPARLLDQLTLALARHTGGRQATDDAAALAITVTPRSR
jgi:PAS domain S-box-containing protein